MNTGKKESGAVSLFIVVFTALLISVVTISFIRIMVRDQEQASTVDLSQSAYDSALAGVEDAKRALLHFQTVCQSDATTPACVAATSAMAAAATQCNVGLSQIGIDATADEVMVQQSTDSSARALDQAYTCVNILLKTPDYLGILQADGSKIIPIRSDSAFDTVRLEWYSTQNLPAGGGVALDLMPNSTMPQPLLNQASWGQDRPSVMRAQLMQFGGNGFTLGDFEGKNAAGESNANTLFLYPTDGASPGTASNPETAFIGTESFGVRDVRKSAPTGSTGGLQSVKCYPNLSIQKYACRVDLKVPTPIGAGDRTAFLRLSALYNATDYRVSLYNGATAVKLDGVQPQIDSTGRANDLFRRVQSRVELAVDFPYPDAAVDITGNFCKNFTITDNPADYTTACTP